MYKILSKKLNYKSLIVIAIFFIVILVYSYFETYLLRVRHLDFNSMDIPEQFDECKIIFVSDIHHGPYYSIKRVSSLVNKINRMNPDIVLLGGDYIYFNDRYIEPVFKELATIKPKIFFGGVLGNHDHWESSELVKLNMDNAGISCLDNASFWIEKDSAKIKIGGVGDLFEDNQLIVNTESDVLSNDFVILVSHNPDFFAEIDDDLIDLVLAGHTHGGQISFFGLWAPFVPIQHKEYWKGMINNQYSSMYVTTGVGTIGLPLRFFSRPEIVEIVLHRK